MLAGTGVIWAAVYMLWMLQRVVFGKITKPENAKLHDLNARELGLFIYFLFAWRPFDKDGFRHSSFAANKFRFALAYTL